MVKKTAKGKKEDQKKSFGAKARDYFSSLKFEWQKVTFPSRKELTQSTIVVFLFTIILMAVLSLYDYLMSLLLNEWLFAI